MKMSFCVLFVIIAGVFRVNSLYCDQYYGNIEQNLLEVDANQMKMLKNQLVVEVGEGVLLPIRQLWQSEEGRIFITLGAADPNYRYSCIQCGFIYEYRPIECIMPDCNSQDFMRVRR